MGHALSWKPNSLLMAATQRFGGDYASGRDGRQDVIFIEKNVSAELELERSSLTRALQGLRHGEFSLREESGSQPVPGAFDAPSSLTEQPWAREHAVRELSWNCDGSLLAVWLQRADSPAVVQIWSPTNYSWTLRSELPALAGEICSLRWHPENALCLYVVSPHLIVERVWKLEETISPGDVPTDVACAAVVDGCSVRLTPLRTHNVPPPYAAFTLVPSPGRGRAIAHVAWADASIGTQAKSLLAVLFADVPEVAIYSCAWGELGPRAPVGGWKAPSPQLVCTVNASEGPSTRPFVAHQVGLDAAVSQSGDMRLQLVVIGVHDSMDVSQAVQRIELHVDAQGEASKDVRSTAKGTSFRQYVPVRPASTQLHEDRPRVLLQDDLGHLFAADTPQDSLAALPEFCPYVAIAPSLAAPKTDVEAGEEYEDSQSTSPRVVGLSGAGVLYVESNVVSRDATSFALSGDMLVWSSTAHQVRFLQLSADNLSRLGSETESTETLALSRRVERGSRIVAAVPSSMSLVLQMPRGNLETIYPRPLVLAVVRRNVAEAQYAQAFLVCRTHRVDLNVLAQDERFVSHLDEFVAQIGEAEHINLFLSSVSGEPSKTNAVCDSMRAALERADAQRYVTSILTTHVRKQPPDFESALLLLRDIKGRDEAAADAACQYLIFLADADKLFDAALGLYDFVLPLLVAQHSPRRDPREYLAELRELRANSNLPYQRFRIDDRLARHAKAVTWLTQAGPEHHDEAIEYVLRHELYQEAMAAWAGDAGKLREAQTLYGNWLLGKKRASEAANAYAMAGQTRLAIDAHKSDNQWREVFALALSPPRMGTQEVQLLAQELSMSLEEAARYEDAAQVALQYGRDVERAVDMLGRGGHFSEARRVCALHSRLDLVETHIKPATLETHTHLLEDVADMTSQVDRTVERLAALRIKKAEDPDSFYPDEDPVDDGRSDTATRITSFTRFTRFTRLTSLTSLASGPTALSSASSARTGMTAKRRKKEEKKKASGKKGSIYEEDYLFDSLARLLGSKLETCQASTAALLPHLLQLSSAHRLAGHALTEALSAFETHAASAVAALSEAVAAEHASIEALRLDALRSAVSQGSPFADLLAAGLFAPVPLREPIKVSQSKWRCGVLDAMADTKTPGAH
jgi:elongator complex protein 1